MRKLILFALAMSWLVATTQRGRASEVSLYDWCVNLNGDVSTACNLAGGGGMSPGGGSISLASFDTTLENMGSNSLGTITLDLAPGAGQYAAFYADYDVDYASYGSADDYATVHGSLPAGYSYEIDDPNYSNIFSDFAGNTLSNQNNVGTPAGPPANCCDVSFALAIGGIDVPVGESGTVTFTVSSVAPSSGFYIQQTNQDTGDSIYLQSSVNIVGGGSPVPEPSFYGAIALLGLIMLGISYRKNRSSAEQGLEVQSK